MFLKLQGTVKIIIHPNKLDIIQAHSKRKIESPIPVI